MPENPNLVDVIAALALQADLCLKQLSDVELRLAEWHTNGCAPSDFPLSDYQKIDLIKQRLSDIQSILQHSSEAGEHIFSELQLTWDELSPHIVLGETRAAIAQGAAAIDEAEKANGN